MHKHMKIISHKISTEFRNQSVFVALSMFVISKYFSVGIFRFYIALTGVPFVCCISINYGNFIFNYSPGNQGYGCLQTECVFFSPMWKNVGFYIDNCLIYILIKKRQWFPDTFALLLGIILEFYLMCSQV